MSRGALCWSPDGTAIAAGGGQVVHVWDVAAGILRRTIKGYRASVVELAWSPDGARIASAGSAGRVRVVDAVTGKLDRSFTGHGTACWTVGWSPDGHRIAAAGRGGQVVLWDLTTGLGPRIRVTYRSPGVKRLAWSPDGARILTGDVEGGVHVWDAGSRTKIWSATAVKMWVGSVAWSPDGTAIVCGSHHTVRVWDLSAPSPDPAPTARLTGHKAVVQTVAWSPAATLIATSDLDNTVHLWRADAVGTERTPVRSLAVPAGRDVAWSPDGRTLATGGPDVPVRLWDPATGRLTATLTT